MIIIRPITAQDYPALYNCAVKSGIGFTSLPVNEDLLRRKISRAERSFKSDVEVPGDQGYLFVMQDSDSGEILGTSGIEAAVGLEDAFYHYHLGKVVHHSRELNVRNAIDILTLCNDYTGSTEICTLYLHEHARKNDNGKFLSKFRFLFLAEHRQRFSDRVIAEMRGVSDDNGKSPFWAWLEEHFFSMDFPTVDYLTGIGQKQFIAELMPTYPVYVSLLSKDAQAVIGQVHEKTRPALKLLQSEGFSSRGYVDIFDAGPTVEASLDHIRTARASRRLPVKIGEPEHAAKMLMINTSVQDFRAVMQEASVRHNRLIISADTASALNVADGDAVRFAPLS